MVRNYFESTFKILGEKEASLLNMKEISSGEREQRHANLLAERDSLENLVENFIIVDANKKPVTGVDAKVIKFNIYILLLILNFIM